MVVSGYEQNIIVGTGKHYLYRHIRSDKGEPFYIGIGTTHIRDDKYGSHVRATARKYTNKIWMGIASRTSYDVEILLESDNYEFIKQKEQEFIKLYGRINLGTGTLANLTDGGEGTRGMRKIIYTDELRKRMSDSHKGKRLSPESQAKRVATLKEKYRINPPKLSDEQKERLRQIRTGSVQSTETKIKVKTTNERLRKEFKSSGDLFLKKGHSKPIQNTNTGELFYSIAEAAKSISMKDTTLRAKLAGQNKNETPFIYYIV